MSIDSRTQPEVWRPIAGYEGLYDVSNHGRVRSWVLREGSRVSLRPEPKIKAAQKGGAKGQYRKVVLWGRYPGGESRYVHLLVAEAFLGPCPPDMESAHDDGVGDHNWLSNLAWKTRRDNHADKRRHGTQPHGEDIVGAKLTEAQVREIRAMPLTVSSRAVAETYGVSSSTIRHIRRGETWRHIL